MTGHKTSIPYTHLGYVPAKTRPYKEPVGMVEFPMWVKTTKCVRGTRSFVTPKGTSSATKHGATKEVVTYQADFGQSIAQIIRERR